MSASGGGLGRVLNYIKTASGVDVPLTQATAVTFVFGDAGVGAAIATVTQTDSTGVNSEIDLDLADQFQAYKGPDVGGTWTAMSPTAGGNTIDLADDTANDTGVFTVRAEQLADGYDQVQVTVDTGTCSAIIHDLLVQRKPSNLRSSLTA